MIWRSAEFALRANGIDFSVLLLYNYEEKFADADLITKDNRGYVEAIYEKGIMIGDENRNFEPHSYLKREEMAQILLNIEANILEKNRLAKREGIIEAIDVNEISLSDENGDIIIIDIN